MLLAGAYVSLCQKSPGSGDSLCAEQQGKLKYWVGPAVALPEPDSQRQKASGLLQRGELKVSSELVHFFHALLSQKLTWTESRSLSR